MVKIPKEWAESVDLQSKALFSKTMGRIPLLMLGRFLKRQGVPRASTSTPCLFVIWYPALPRCLMRKIALSGLLAASQLFCSLSGAPFVHTVWKILVQARDSSRHVWTSELENKKAPTPELICLQNRYLMRLQGFEP